MMFRKIAALTFLLATCDACLPFHTSAPQSSTEHVARRGCAASKAQRLRGRCFEATNFIRTREILGAHPSAPINAFPHDAVSTPEADALVVQLSKVLDQRFGNEMAFRIDARRNASGEDTAQLSHLETERANRHRTAIPVTALGGAHALVHTHSTLFSDILPGPRDWEPAALGLPNYVMFDERALVVEVSGGQVRARIIAGRLDSRERRLLLAVLSRFQEHGAALQSTSPVRPALAAN